MSYTTVANVRRYARGITDDRVPDADIVAFIADAEAMINLYARTTFGDPAEVTEYYDGREYGRLALRHYPVTSITSVKYRKDDSGSLEDLDEFNPLTGEGDYQLQKAASGLLRFTSDSKRPTSGIQNVQVVYYWGYSETPADVAALCSILAAISTLARASGEVSPDGLVSINEGALSLSWGGGPYMETVQLLERQAQAYLTKIGRFLKVGSADIQPV